MAIAYMHIPTTWRTWLPPDVPPGDQARRVMMCGRKARYRLSGIPGVTRQPSIVNGRSGWCIQCLRAFLEDARTQKDALPRSHPIHEMYDLAINVSYDALVMVLVEKDLVSNNGH